MKIDFSKFKPEDFLPILGTTCPALDDLQTGDLLFPRLSDAVEAKSEKRDSYWFPRMAAILKNSKNNETPIKDILGEQAVAEIMKKIETRQYTQHRTLDITAVMADGLAEALNRKHNSSSISTKFDEFHKNKINKSNNHNSLYTNNNGMQAIRELLNPDALQTEGVGIDFEKIFEDPRSIQLIIDILNTAKFGDVTKKWFDSNREFPKTLFEFITDPLVELLFNLLTADDVRTNVFIGHVGIVIRENNKIYIIEANITSYAHYRVAIHPYYVEDDNKNINKYLTERYNNRPTPYDPSKDYTDYELPAAQASGWVNRRAAMLEHVWHARPKGLDETLQNKLIATVKALHGRPYGFFDHPDLGHDDRVYCSEFVFNVFKHAVSEDVAKELIKKMKWSHVREYLKKEKNAKMLKFVEDVLKDDENYGIEPDRDFFVLQPAILWNSPHLDRNVSNWPGGKGMPYAPEI